MNSRSFYIGDNMKKINYDLLNDIMYFSKRILKLVYIFIVSVIVFLGIKLIKEVGILEFIFKILHFLFPLFVGFGIAWILNPLVDKLENRGLKRSISSVIIFICFIFLIGGLLFLLVPILYNQILDLSDYVPQIVEILNDNIKGSDFNKYIDQITNQLPSMFIDVVKHFISIIGVIGLSLLFSLYLMIDYHRIIDILKRILKKKEYTCLLTGINKEVRKCVNGTFLVASLVFVMDTILFLLVGLPSPLLFGLLCGVTDLIPYVGPYIGGIAAVLVGFSQSKLLGIITIIIVIVVQTIENMVLQPIVMSRATKLHPITIILGLIIFGELFGIVGMVLATPIVAMIKVIIQYIKKCFCC